MFTWYVLQHDYCCNHNCCCIFVSYLPWQPQLLCCIFGQLHNNCTCFVCIFLQTSSIFVSALECYAKRKIRTERNWKTTIKGFQGFRRGQSHNVGIGFKTTPNTTVSPFWCWFKTSVLPTRQSLPFGVGSRLRYSHHDRLLLFLNGSWWQCVMHCLPDCPCDNKHVSVTYALSPGQFVYCPCDNKHVSVTLVASCSHA
jgi:hypothetical protein